MVHIDIEHTIRLTDVLGVVDFQAVATAVGAAATTAVAVRPIACDWAMLDVAAVVTIDRLGTMVRFHF